MRQLLPGARFLVNTRNLDEVVKSKWWADNPDARKTLEAMESRLLEAAKELGDNAYHVHCDDYAATPERLAGLFEWWGEEMDIDRIRRTIRRRHSY